ncbi:MAG: Fe-S-containing protein [Thermoleophilia bacterium]
MSKKKPMRGAKPSERSTPAPRRNGGQRPSGNAVRGDLDSKRQRFEEAGKFPVAKVLTIGVVVAVLAFGGFAAYEYFVAPQPVGSVAVAGAAAAGEAPVSAKMVEIASAQQAADGLSFPVQDLKDNAIVALKYDRATPMPAEYQALTGGDVLPLLSYIAPSGNLVVATSFCEPCRGTSFHVEGDALVCDVCFTRWDLNTLEGISGGCLLYPPEVVAAELRGDTVFVPTADLEAWLPRAF